MSEVSKVSGGWDAARSAVVAGWGPWTTDRVLARALVRGPSGSTLRLYIGDDAARNLLLYPFWEVDYSLVGSEDYGSWTPPLWVPAGWSAAFAWTGGSSGAASAGTARVEWDLSQ